MPPIADQAIHDAASNLAIAALTMRAARDRHAEAHDAELVARRVRQESEADYDDKFVAFTNLTGRRYPQ